jgi:hypothetical protein
MKIRTGLIVAGGGLLLLTASANAQMRGGGFHGGFGGMHGAPMGGFRGGPMGGFSGAPNGVRPGAPNGGFRGGPTAAPTMGTGTMAIIIMATVTRASWSASGSLVGVGAGDGVILTGIRPIIMLRTATTATTAHHNTMVEGSNRCITAAWSQAITASRVSIYATG